MKSYGILGNIYDNVYYGIKPFTNEEKKAIKHS